MLGWVPQLRGSLSLSLGSKREQKCVEKLSSSCPAGAR
jgi:hypothetical protein